MTTQSTHDLAVGPPGVIAPSGPNILAFPFYVNNDIALTKIGWYRAATGANWGPSQLRVYNHATGLPVNGTLVTVPADNGAVGWQRSTLASPVQLSAGVLYSVAGLCAAGKSISYFGGGFRQSPPSLFAFPSNTRYTAGGSVWAFPATGDTGQQTYWFDATVDDSVTPPSGPNAATPSDVDTKLAAWLADGSDNTHKTGDTQPGLPYTTKAVVDATAADVTTVKAAATGANGFDAIKAVADAIASAVGGIPGTIAAAVTTITGQITTSATAIAGAGFHTIAELYTQGTNTISHIADLTLRSVGGTAAYPASFTLIDSTTFDTSLAWDVQADLYVVTFTGLGARIVNTIVAGVDISYRLAWWCPQAGGFAQERRFIDSPQYHCYDGGRRMPGLLLHSELGGTGTVEAWRLS